MKTIGHDIWKATSPTPGPHMMVLGGVHGNELPGIRLVQELRERFSADGALMCGTLTLALGNPEAVRLGTRGSAPHRDLNRCFLPERLTAPATCEETRAAELAPRIAEADILIDLHATNEPSVPFVVATTHDARRAELAALFPCGLYVVAPDEVIAGSTDGWIARRGGLGLGYECGYAEDLASVAGARVGLDRVLRWLGLAAGGGEAVEPKPQTIVRIVEPLLLGGGSFVFASGRGRSCFEPFATGDVLGHTDGRPFLAPYDGLLLFPKPAHLHAPGAPVGFLAVEEDK